MAIPILKVDQIVEQIQSLQLEQARDGHLNQILWHRLLRECEQQCKLNVEHAAEAYRLIGALYALVGQRENMLGAYSKAARLLPLSGHFLLDQANNAQRVGLIPFATERLQAAMVHDWSDPELVARIGKLSYGIGLYHVTLEALKRLQVLQREDLASLEMSRVRQAIELMTQHGATEEDVNQRVSLAYNVLFKRLGTPFTGYRQSITPHGIALEIISHAPLTDLVAADWDIAEQMLVHFDNPLDTLITISAAAFGTIESHNVDFI